MKARLCDRCNRIIKGAREQYYRLDYKFHQCIEDDIINHGQPYEFDLCDMCYQIVVSRMESKFEDKKEMLKNK